ncbi:MAG: lipocalin-like domain-containing protein [Thermoanaerobaculia bacterium]
MPPDPGLRESPLSSSLPGTWRLVSRIDVTAGGERRPEPSLGEDPIALLIYDRAGHFSAQFMKRDRVASAPETAPSPAAPNNTRAMGGYDAYFGTYVVDDARGEVTQHLQGALSPPNVGQTVTRAMSIAGGELTIRLETRSADGEQVVRTLVWRRVG